MGTLLVRNRRYLGFAMALAHTVQFVYVVLFPAVLDQSLDLLTGVFGGAALVLMWLMAATSNDVSVRRLGKRWKTLHPIGVHYLWLIFMQTMGGRLGNEAQSDFLFAFVIPGLLAAGLRIAAYRVVRSRRSG
ncbi:MAG: hypothetical protein AAF513_01600 [Pseudomonadota bacterium]